MRPRAGLCRSVSSLAAGDGETGAAAHVQTCSGYEVCGRCARHLLTPTTTRMYAHYRYCIPECGPQQTLQRLHCGFIIATEPPSSIHPSAKPDSPLALPLALPPTWPCSLSLCRCQAQPRYPPHSLKGSCCPGGRGEGDRSKGPPPNTSAS